MDYKTPGVYVVEKNAFANSVVAVATAVPGFIGYTETAEFAGRSLKNRPFKVTSFVEFLACFGGPPPATFRVSSTPGKDYTAERAEKREQQFLLYWSMVLFFDNGGGDCYVVSVGSTTGGVIADGDLIAGMDLLLSEQEPTMVVIPDAVHLPTAASCIRVQQAAIAHCGKTRSRIAILDIYDGYKDRNDLAGDCVALFRNDIGAGALDFAAAYYPWLNTSVAAHPAIDYRNVAADDLTTILKAEGAVPQDIVAEVTTLKAHTAPEVNNILVNLSNAFRRVMVLVAQQINLLPPSAAMAGIYMRSDSSHGVWKAPANTSPVSVVSPAVAISQDEQENLIVDIVEGKSINAIRVFPGLGLLVWGARTLDGNSADWRYISVRRTMIMLEQSIQFAIQAFVFAENATGTWETIQAMIGNFLTDIWKSGGLRGATAADAFSVSCGLGETMTAEDILEGILRVTVQVALTRPGEFIVTTFQLQMQQS